jgi:hypothetical protein
MVRQTHPTQDESATPYGALHAPPTVALDASHAFEQTTLVMVRQTHPTHDEIPTP